MPAPSLEWPQCGDNWLSMEEFLGWWPFLMIWSVDIFYMHVKPWDPTPKIWTKYCVTGIDMVYHILDTYVHPLQTQQEYHMLKQPVFTTQVFFFWHANISNTPFLEESQCKYGPNIICKPCNPNWHPYTMFFSCGPQCYLMVSIKLLAYAQNMSVWHKHYWHNWAQLGFTYSTTSYLINAKDCFWIVLIVIEKSLFDPKLWMTHNRSGYCMWNGIWKPY